MKIKNMDDKVICYAFRKTLRQLAEDNRDRLTRANLWRANLRGANLWAAEFEEANLAKANLAKANLAKANLKKANLWKAYLRKANLAEAELDGANLEGANLIGANIEFRQFPSIRFLSGLNLGSLSDELTLELMRRCAYAHPQPEKFDEWAKDEWGEHSLYPYDDVEEFWYFERKKELYQPGPPQMTDRDLIVVICREKGWKLKHR